MGRRGWWSVGFWSGWHLVKLKSIGTGESCQTWYILYCECDGWPILYTWYIPIHSTGLLTGLIDRHDRNTDPKSIRSGAVSRVPSKTRRAARPLLFCASRPLICSWTKTLKVAYVRARVAFVCPFHQSPITPRHSIACIYIQYIHSFVSSSTLFDYILEWLTVHRYSRSRSENWSYTQDQHNTCSRTDKSTRPDLVRQPFSFAITFDRHLITNHQSTINPRLIPTTDYTCHSHSFGSGYTYANTEKGAN